MVRCEASAACNIAACVAGMKFESVDDVVKDAIGEICKALAGTWKSKSPDLAANWCLSVQAVITGSDYSLHVQSPEFRTSQTYAFDNTFRKDDRLRWPAVGPPHGPLSRERLSRGRDIRACARYFLIVNIF